MSRRPLASLLGLLALLAVGLFWLVHTVGRESSAPAEAPTPVAAAPAADAPAPALQASTPDTPIETAAAAPEREEVANAAKSLAPEDAVWFEGRVQLPPGTPDDEHVEVTALANYTDRHEPERTPLAPDGSFRIAVSKSATRATIDLASRYVYLSEPLRITLADRPKDAPPIVLSPKLGGCIHGRMILPPNALDRRESIVGTRVGLSAMVESGMRIRGRDLSRSTKADAALEFELGGIPPERHVYVSAEPPAMTQVGVDAPPIQVGHVVPMDLELQLGGHVSGFVVDEQGAAVAEVEISTFIERGMASWSGNSDDKSAADGAFDLTGIRPGKLTLRANKAGYADSDLEVGAIVDGLVKDGLSLVMHRGLSITGRVQWSDGRPANGCKIEVENPPPNRERRFSWRSNRAPAFARPDGTFEISGLGSEPVTLNATLEKPAETGAGASAETGLGLAHVEDVKPDTSGLVVVLEPAKSVRGRAVDDTGQPIARFQVSAVPIDGSQTWERERKAVKASGNSADGHFEISGLHDGAWDVTAEAKDHAKSAAHRVVIPAATEPFDVVLPRTASVSGTVTDTKGAPVERASVAALPPRNDGFVFTASRDEDAKTDAQGRFVLDHVPPGPQKISASLEGFADSELLPVDLSPGQAVTGLELALRTGGRIVGEVLDDAGHGQPDRKIGASGMAVRTHRTVTTDASGHFEIGSLPSGTYWLNTQPTEKEIAAATKPGEEADVTAWQRIQKQATADVVDGETTHVVLGGSTREGIRVHGRITCADKPAANWMVWVMRADKARNSSPQSGVSDEQGRYEVSVESAGSYSIMVNGQKAGVSFNDRLDVPAGASFEHDIVIPAGSISGRILGPDGAPAERIQVVLQPDERTAELSSSASYGEKQTDAKGVFAFEGLKGGTYSLRVMQGWFGETSKLGASTRSGIVLPEGGHVDGIEIKLAAAARIEGKLVGPDGQAVAGATVTVRDEQGVSIEHWPPTVSDGSGAFSIDGLAAGKVALTARTKTLVSATSPTVTVRAGETTPVEMTLVVGTVLRVVVQEADGKAVGASVRVLDANGKSVGERYAFGDESMFGEDSPDAGQKIGPVPAGRYKVTATNHDKQSVSQDVSVSGAEQVVTLKYGG